MLWFGSVCFYYFSFCHFNFFLTDVLDALTWKRDQVLFHLRLFALTALKFSLALWIPSSFSSFRSYLKNPLLINKFLLFTIFNFVYLFICSLSNLCKFTLHEDRELVFLSCQEACRHSAHIWWMHQQVIVLTNHQIM